MVYSIAVAKRQFSDLVKRAAYRGETVTIGSRGKAEAALVSIEELRRLRALELERDARLLEDAVRRFQGSMSVAGLLRAWKTADDGDRHPPLKGAPRRATVGRAPKKDPR